MNEVLLIGTTNFSLDGILVRQAPTIDSALWQIHHRNPPDLIILPSHLNGESGITITRKLRTIPLCAYCPILILHSNWNSAQRSTAFAAGANDIMPIACHPLEVQLRLEALLRQRDWLINRPLQHTGTDS